MNWDFERVRQFFHAQQLAGMYGSHVCLFHDDPHGRKAHCVDRAEQFVAHYEKRDLRRRGDCPHASVDYNYECLDCGAFLE